MCWHKQVRRKSTDKLPWDVVTATKLWPSHGMGFYAWLCTFLLPHFSDGFLISFYVKRSPYQHCSLACKGGQTELAVQESQTNTSCLSQALPHFVPSNSVQLAPQTPFSSGIFLYLITAVLFGAVTQNTLHSSMAISLWAGRSNINTVHCMWVLINKPVCNWSAAICLFCSSL